MFGLRRMSKLEIAKICDRCDSWMIPTRVDKDGQHWYCPVCGTTEPKPKKIKLTTNTNQEKR